MPGFFVFLGNGYWELGNGKNHHAHVDVLRRIRYYLVLGIGNMVKTHKDLEVWQRSISFVTHIYQVTANFPKEELFGLSAQMRRSAISIPSNVACPVK